MRKKKKKHEMLKAAILLLFWLYLKKKEKKKNCRKSVFMQTLVIWCVGLIILAYQEVNDK